MDAEQFRVFHAVGRFRGILSASLFTFGFFHVYSGFHGGRAAMRSNPLLSVAVFGGSFAVSYQFWTRVAGYNSQKYNEF